MPEPTSTSTSISTSTSMAAVDRRVLCLVPARSGSTRIPDKNIQVLDGSTLLARAIRTGRQAFGRVLVSTDSQSYADEARAAGAEVPGLRPARLAAADTPIDAVVEHALACWSDGRTEILVVVQPTSPFTLADDLTAVVKALDDNPTAGCALTAVAVAPTAAFVLAAGDDGLSRALAPQLSQCRTQDVPPLAIPTGGAYAARIARLADGGALVAEPIALVLVDETRSLDIDEPSDLARARRLVSGL
jgi:CMP-N-acetylneuraminic acid synthetase